MSERTYSELVRFSTFRDRFQYLRLQGVVGNATFGFDRNINQAFYKSYEWRMVREEVIVRDEGCDLGVPGQEIYDEILVHHMNPVTLDSIMHRDEWILNPEFLITTKHSTHNAIHYGDESLLPVPYIPRTPGDTKLW